MSKLDYWASMFLSFSLGFLSAIIFVMHFSWVTELADECEAQRDKQCFMYFKEGL